MCGIAGIWNLRGESASLEALSNMLYIQQHRGPEGAAFTSMNHSSVLLGFLQLGFTDTQAGMQPLFNEDGSIAIVYNGEIYDYEITREDLINRGHVFTTKSDTEVLIHLYEEYGIDFLHKLNGEFAFALYDDNKKQLLLARDPYGINPLAFAFNNKQFYFSSEAKGILATPHFERELNTEYLASVAVGIPNTRPTLFKNIENLRPGHYMIVDKNGLRTHQYWMPRFIKSTDDFPTAKYKIRSLIKKAVARRVNGEIPMALALSSGLDSTIIAGQVKALGYNKPVFSLGFPGKPYDESHVAESTCKYYGLPFNRVTVTLEELANDFIKALWHAENSTNSISNAARFFMHGSIRRSGHKAIMGGEAGDEIFGGYPYFLIEAIWRKQLDGDITTSKTLLKKFKSRESKSHRIFWDQPKNWQTRTCPYQSPVFAFSRSQNVKSLSKWLWHGEMAKQVNKYSAEALFLEEIPPKAYGELTGFDTTRLVARSIASTFVYTGLGDRLEMGNSLEGRVPFLDQDLIDYAFSLPEDYFIDLPNLTGKHILKEAYSDLIPTGFMAPFKHTFMSPTFSEMFKTSTGKEMYHEFLDKDKIKNTGIINPSLTKMIKTLWRAFPRSASSYLFIDSIIGLTLSLQVLNRIFIEKNPFALAEEKPLELKEHLYQGYVNQDRA